MENGGSPGGAPVGPDGGTTTTVIVRHTQLLKGIPSEVEQLQFIARDAAGTVVFGPELRDKVPEIRLQIPRSARSLEILYLAAGQPVAVVLIDLELGQEVITILDPQLEYQVNTLVIQPSALRVAARSQRQLKAVASLGVGAVPRNVTEEATWTSSDPSVASVSPGGLLTVTAPGQATITATIAPNSASIVVNCPGQGSFSGFLAPQVTPLADGPFGHLPQVGDLNGDGIPDVVCANQEITLTANHVEVFLGQTDGTLGAPTVYPAGFVRALRLGDLNGDLKLDLVVCTNRTFPYAIAGMLGNGDGTFGPIQETQVNLNPTNDSLLELGDVNQDGRLDAIIGGSGDAPQPIVTCFGNGDGTFTVGPSFNVGRSPSGLALGDITGDNRLDVLVSIFDAASGAGPGQIESHAGNGDGTFQGAQVLPATAGVWPHHLRLGDVNEDGRLDLVAAYLGSPTINVFTNQGGGTLVLSRALEEDNSGGLTLGALRLTDLNRDGHLDLVSLSSTWTGDGSGDFHKVQTFSPPIWAGLPESIQAADMDRDGIVDLVVPASDSSIGILFGQGDASFPSPLPVDLRPTDDLVSGDFDEDGRPDLVSREPMTGKTTVTLSRADGTFVTSASLDPGPDEAQGGLVVADFDQDTHLDLATAQDGSIRVLSGRGDGIFDLLPGHALSGRPARLATADFNQDGLPDLAVGFLDSPGLSILLGRGDATFRAEATLSTSRPVSALTAADLDQDGRTDLAVGQGDDSNIQLWFGNGDGVFEPRGRIDITTPQNVVAADFNQDGRLDLAILAGTGNPGNVWLALNSGGGGFSAPQIVAGASLLARSLLTADMNFDGLPDLIVSPQTFVASPDTLILFSNGDGTFPSNFPVAFPIAGPAAVADFDLDGKPDLVLSSRTANAGSIFLQRP
ncbi:MAG: hypothetical protein AMXMBFR33_28800 [Candidatus Xenobia bacterium]